MPMKTICQWLERLSLDAVIVAGVWGAGLSITAGRSGILHDILILGLATWLTYVADRLWETRPGNDIPDTDRHRFYSSHFRQFKYLWIAVFVVSVSYAVMVLPLWKIICGWSLVLAIGGYLFAIARIERDASRMLFKRVLVPLIFTAGVILMSDAWRTWESMAGAILLLNAALSNVFLISYRENRDEEMPQWLPGVTIKSVFTLMILANAALFIHWQAGIAGLLCFAGYFVLFVKLRSGYAGRVRIWVDGILAAAGLLLLVL